MSRGTLEKPKTTYTAEDVGALPKNGNAVSATAADRLKSVVYKTFAAADSVRPSGEFARFYSVQQEAGTIDPDSPYPNKTGPYRWNVIEFGIVSRCTQIANQAYHHASPNHIHIRTKHDANWSSWSDHLLDGYPVGSFYASTNAASPASLFGGTWMQIGAGRFPVAAGDGYAAGSTGGLASVSLTAEQNGPHTHPVNEQLLRRQNNDLVNFGSSGTLGGFTLQAGANNVGESRIVIPAFNTNSSGSGSAHENRPPYFALYMWYRIA